MSNFDESQARRGQPGNAGKFANKTNSAPESSLDDETILVYNSSSRKRDLARPVLARTTAGAYAVVDDRKFSKSNPYAIFHVGTGKNVPTSSNIHGFGTQKINKQFAQDFEDAAFFDDSGNPLAPTRKIILWVRDWASA